MAALDAVDLIFYRSEKRKMEKCPGNFCKCRSECMCNVIFTHGLAVDRFVPLGGLTDDQKVRIDLEDRTRLFCGDHNGLEEWLQQITLDDDDDDDDGVVVTGDTSEVIEMEPDNAARGQVGMDLPTLECTSVVGMDLPTLECASRKPCRATGPCPCAKSSTPAYAPSFAPAPAPDATLPKEEDATDDAPMETMLILEGAATPGGPICEWVEMRRRFDAPHDYAPTTPVRPTKGEILDFFAHFHCRCDAQYDEDFYDGTCGYCTSGLRKRVRAEMRAMASAKRAKKNMDGVKKTLFVGGGDDEGGNGWPEPML